jgi:hypothetical protein
MRATDGLRRQWREDLPLTSKALYAIGFTLGVCGVGAVFGYDGAALWLLLASSVLTSLGTLYYSFEVHRSSRRGR